MSKLLCWLFGHKYEYHQPLSKESDMIVCNCCKSKWAMHHVEKILLPWDADFQKIYKEVFNSHILKTDWEE